MDSGLAGLVAAETVLSHSDGARGILWVRGHTLPDLAANFGYDGAVGLLWEGFTGEGLTRDIIRARLGAAREHAFAWLADWLDLAATRSPVEGVRLALAALPEGGAPGPTLDMLDEAAASGDVAAWAERKLAAGERLIGFGHRVFRLGDPRATLLRQALEKLGGSLGPGAGRLAFAAEVERSVGEAFARLKPGRPPLRPNVEINAALLLDAVGLPRDAFMPVFAVARGAGWLAHAMEQQKEGRLVRPSSAYVGPVPAGANASG